MDLAYEFSLDNENFEKEQGRQVPMRAYVIQDAYSECPVT